jgi:uncharacterized membrane protein YsdA (DUF1294 family)
MSTRVLVLWEPTVLLLIALVGVILTVYDKRAAKKNPRNRVPENVLMLFAVLGGALPMYLTMLLIRHKTRHKKFMVGLPVIIALQIAAAAAIVWFMSR